MTTRTTFSRHSVTRSCRALRDSTAIALVSAAASLVAVAVFGQALAADSTWLELAIDTNYNDVINWSPNSVPDSGGDNAIFGQSNTTNLTITAPVTVDSWVFNADADNYVFTSDQALVFLGDGIVVNGGTHGIFNNPGGELLFFGGSSAGNVLISNSSVMGFGPGASAGNATITNNVGGSLIFGGGSAGTASITNHELTQFFGATAANATITTMGTGTTEFHTASTAGSATLIVNGGGVLIFLASATAGNATIVSNGQLFFADTTSSANATILNDGTLAFSHDATAGNATITNGGGLTFLGDSTAGNAEITNANFVEFVHAATAGNAMIVNDNIIEFFDSSTAGNAALVNNGQVFFGDASSGGSARLINGAAATTSISPLTNVGTTIGSIEGEGAIVLGSRVLVTGLNNLSTEFGGTISGVGGSLGKVGDGTLVLSGVNSYTGVTQVSSGTMIVNGSIASSSGVNVTNGGRLGGTGTVAATSIFDGGTLAPGNSIGTLNVAGNVTFNPGSNYEVEVNSAGQSDLLNATGTATLNGGTVQVLPFPDFAIDTQYTILTAAGGVGGTFDGVGFGSGSLFLAPSLTYGANDVFLNIAQTAGFESVALTPNQIAAAGGAQSLGGGPLFTAIALLGDVGEAQAAFDAISGEIHASAKSALIEDSRFVREAAIARLGAADNGLGIWIQGFGARGHTGTDGNAAALDRSIGGLFIGADGEVLDGWQAGVLAGYSRSSFSAGDRASSGAADSYHLGVYGGTEWNDLAVRFGTAHSWHNLDISRTAALTGFSDSLSSGYSAGTGQVFGEVGYGIDTGTARFEPFANLAWVNHATSGYSETGGAAALTGTRDTVNATFTTLGLRASTDVAIGEVGTARLSGMVGWRHAFGNVPTAANSFVAGGNAFTVAGVPLARDALVLEMGLDLEIAPEATFGVHYSGQVGSGVSDHALKARLGVMF